MSSKELQDLSDQIRQFILNSVSSTGGHLSSNLGTVELTVALHKVFHSPKDKILFDVGHQSYTHKILTGRKDRFYSLRQKDGLSGFQRRSESEHDPWEAGHSSTSISAALGMAAARDLLGQDFEIVSVIGDGAITGGMALEALNDLGAQQRKVIIIFNDNKMSISKNHGGMETAITHLRTSELYRNTKKEVNSSKSANPINKTIHKFLHAGRTYLKNQFIDAPLFSQFNLDYIGPVDGHNMDELIPVLETARDHDGPIVVHVVTKKGKGYPLAEKDTIGAWHGVGPFDLATGRPKALHTAKEISWSEIISNTLIDLAAADKTITAITPAMANGSRLLKFQSIFPDRFFDCGIAEQHALTLAAGMAVGGLHPFVSVYSTFLQRAYDQISHDVCRMNLPVVVGVDRAGLVGDDGDTHQGIYDIGYLRSIPNTIICQPKDSREAQDLLYTGFKIKKPFFIRYPKGNEVYQPVDEYQEIPIGSWTKTAIGKPEQVVITYGPDVKRIIKKARTNNMNLLVVNARFFKPIDLGMLREIRDMNLPVTIYETDNVSGGLSDAILEGLNVIEPQVDVMAIQDKFVEHGSIRALRKLENISTEDLFERLEKNVSETRSETGGESAEPDQSTGSDPK